MREQIGFSIRTSEAGYPEIHIKVDGRALSDVIRDVERALVDGDDRRNRIAGSYVGCSPDQLGGGVRAHSLGSAESHLDCGPADKTASLDCRCGCPGCWTRMAEVIVDEQLVTWTI